VIDLVDISAQNVITLPKIFPAARNAQPGRENIRQVQRTVEKARSITRKWIGMLLANSPRRTSANY
jgi:hypothetical protein